MDPLEQFWSDLFSENPALVVAAWVVLSAAEREAVEAHLRSIAADPVRLADQRRAAEYALAHRPGAPRLVLASGSPRRRELVSLLGFPFTTMAADVDESPHAGEDPPGMVARLSREKATAARSSIQTADDPIILLTADTTVSLDGQVVGKPADAAEARSILRRLRGRSHQVFTSVTLIDLATGRQVTDLASTDVPMRDYADAEIEAYIASGDPFDKAGAYAIQNEQFNPVAGLRGCYANVVGLPLCHVTRSLRAVGVEPPADVPTACQTHLKYECPVFQAILAGK